MTRLFWVSVVQNQMYLCLFAPVIKPERPDRTPNQTLEYSKSLDIYVWLGKSKFELAFLSNLTEISFHYPFLWSSCIASSFLSAVYKESFHK